MSIEEGRGESTEFSISFVCLVHRYSSREEIRQRYGGRFESIGR